MLYSLVPDFLVGRNRPPDNESLEFYPPAYRDPVLIRQLPDVDNPAADVDLIALKPDVYIGYGHIRSIFRDLYHVDLTAAQMRRLLAPGQLSGTSCPTIGAALLATPMISRC